MKFEYTDPEFPSMLDKDIVSEETIRVIRRDGKHDIVKKELLVDLIKKGEVIALAEAVEGKSYIPNKLKDIIGIMRGKFDSLDLVNMDKSDRDTILYLKEKLNHIENMFKG